MQDVFATNADGDTCLHLAAERGRCDVLRELLAGRGGKELSTARNGANRSALDVARDSRRTTGERKSAVLKILQGIWTRDSSVNGAGGMSPGESSVCVLEGCLLCCLCLCIAKMSLVLCVCVPVGCLLLLHSFLKLIWRNVSCVVSAFIGVGMILQCFSFCA